MEGGNSNAQSCVRQYTAARCTVNNTEDSPSSSSYSKLDQALKSKMGKADVIPTDDTRQR